MSESTAKSKSNIGRKVIKVCMHDLGKEILKSNMEQNRERTLVIIESLKTTYVTQLMIYMAL